MSAIVLRGDAAHLPLPDGSVDLIMTSPPLGPYFGLRSYSDNGGHYDGQIGSEATPREYLAALLSCTREWVRVLKPSGSLFVNLGDKYSGSPRSMPDQRGTSARPGCNAALAQTRQLAGEYQTDVPAKSLLGLPWRYALRCMDELGLILRAEIVWAKPNGLPESVGDRVRRSHEQLFHMVRRPRYYAAVDEIREPHAPPTGGRGPVSNGTRAQMPSGDRNAGISGIRPDPNPLGKLPGSVWTIPSQPLIVPDWLGVDHFAAYPGELVRRVVLGWSPPGVCTACGEGRRPVVDRTNRPLQRVYNGVLTKVPGASREDCRKGVPQVTEATITGYACACPDATAPTRPALVVDPFGGTGTTALVASVYGRAGVTVDRSADYCRLARWRVRDPAERARALGVPKPPPVPDGQGSLFDDMEALL